MLATLVAVRSAAWDAGFAAEAGGDGGGTVIDGEAGGADTGGGVLGGAMKLLGGN